MISEDDSATFADDSRICFESGCTCGMKRVHQVTSEAATIQAIVEASAHPLAIVLVGVGDGPWDTMREFDG